jgi:hypothetical protein
VYHSNFPSLLISYETGSYVTGPQQELNRCHDREQPQIYDNPANVETAASTLLVHKYIRTFSFSFKKTP